MERRYKRWLAGPLLLSLALLAGCGVKDDTVPADWYGVGDIYAYMKAVQDEEGKVTTTVELRNGASSDADYLYLRDNEYLFSSLDTPPTQYLNFSDDLFSNSMDVSQQLKVMSERDLNHDYLLFADVTWGTPEYYSHAHPDGAAAKRAYVVFQRHDNDQLVGESSVVSPAPFQIQSPAAEATLSRAVPGELTWTDVETGSVMEFDVAGICSDGSRYTL